jgi:hypothetical protein
MSSFFGTPKQQSTPPVPTRNQAMENAYAADELRRRRGMAANILTGRSGAEAATPATKMLLGL